MTEELRLTGTTSSTSCAATPPPTKYSAGVIRGRVLEIGGNEYTRRFGRPEGSGRRDVNVTQSEVLHIGAENAAATIVGDLTSADHIASDSFDCILCTQTLQVIYDVRAAIATLHRILKPGGSVLATFPGITQTCRPDRDHWGDYWRFTSLSARRLFEEAFAPANVSVESYGNVLATVAFLEGIATEELRPDELDLRDPDYEMLVCVRAVK